MKDTMAYKYVFGPVLSGRLGRSLGLDLLGGRICSMDCIYCEVGATRELTTERRVCVPAVAILEELAAWKAEGHATPEAVTLGGLGEPCLNAAMGDVIAGARALFPGTDIAVLTNGTLMADPAVRAELALADAVLPSLDSLVESEFRAVNRPADGITAQGVAEGLLTFRREFAGKIFLEILLVEGVNDSDENLDRLTEFCKRLRPDRVDVVTTTRPGTVKGTRPVGGGDPGPLARKAGDGPAGKIPHGRTDGAGDLRPGPPHGPGQGVPSPQAADSRPIGRGPERGPQTGPPGCGSPGHTGRRHPPGGPGRDLLPRLGARP